MRYRALTADGDYVFGAGAQEFLVDSPACVGQAILTALKLFAGQWFLDTTAGVPWLSEVFGRNSGTYDQIISQAILDVQGVEAIVIYSSSLNRQTRVLTVSATVDTIYGVTQSVTIPIQLP